MKNEKITLFVGDKESGQVESSPEDLEGLPQSVCSLYGELPDVVRGKIFAEKKREVKKQRKLEDIVENFDEEQREAFVLRCLAELFMGKSGIDFKRAFDSDDIGAQITRFLDVVWASRGKRGADVQIFNEAYFDDFSKRYAEMKERVAQRQTDVDKLKKSMEKTRKQKRLAEKKRAELVELNKKLREEEEEMQRFLRVDRGSYGVPFLNYASLREENERRWTEAVVVCAEYMDPVEFSVVVSESMDQQFFYRERQVARGRKDRRLTQTMGKEQVKKFYSEIEAAFEKWQEQHDGERVFKATANVDYAKKQQKMIDYFLSLCASYRRGKERGRSDDEMLVDIRQMEVVLHLLSKREE